MVQQPRMTERLSAVKTHTPGEGGREAVWWVPGGTGRWEGGRVRVGR